MKSIRYKFSFNEIYPFKHFPLSAIIAAEFYEKTTTQIDYIIYLRINNLFGTNLRWLSTLLADSKAEIKYFNS